jgi:DNA-binding NtrC family response regulator
LLEIRHRLEGRYGIESLAGRGPAHERLLAQVRVAAESRTPVTIIGEPGTGKRSIARVIHQCCPRKNLPFLPFDCTVLPPELLERELFDSSQKSPEASARPGSVREATVLLINATDLHRDLQARLIEKSRVDFRLIATSQVSLEHALEVGRIRPDFYYALSTFVIQLRPLRDRVDEISLLAQHFLERANQRGHGVKLSLDEGASRALAAYDWPGNLPELARVIDAAHATSVTESIRVDDLPAEIRGHQASAFLPASTQLESLDQLLTQVERQLIEQALAWTRQNKSKAADVLGISRPRLYRRIKELGIPEDGETTLGDFSNDDHPGS